MATKSKASETQTQASAASLDQLFSNALGQFNGGNLQEAATAMEAVRERAVQEDNLPMARTAASYVRAIQGRLEEVAAVESSPEMAAQLKLNLREPKEALTLLEKALQAAPGRPSLHYLKAVAHAQLDQAEASADALAKAADLQPELIFQYRLEPDFDGVRHSAPFAVFLQA